MNFEVLWLFANVSFTKFTCVASFGGASKQPAIVFPAKNLIFHQFVKVFFHKSFPLCGTATSVGLTTEGGDCLEMKLHAMETSLTFGGREYPPSPAALVC